MITRDMRAVIDASQRRKGKSLLDIGFDPQPKGDQFTRRSVFVVTLLVTPAT